MRLQWRTPAGEIDLAQRRHEIDVQPRFSQHCGRTRRAAPLRSDRAAENRAARRPAPAGCDSRAECREPFRAPRRSIVRLPRFRPSRPKIGISRRRPHPDRIAPPDFRNHIPNRRRRIPAIRRSPPRSVLSEFAIRNPQSEIRPSVPNPDNGPPRAVPTAAATNSGNSYQYNRRTPAAGRPVRVSPSHQLPKSDTTPASGALRRSRSISRRPITPGRLCASTISSGNPGPTFAVARTSATASAKSAMLDVADEPDIRLGPNPWVASCIATSSQVADRRVAGHDQIAGRHRIRRRPQIGQKKHVIDHPAQPGQDPQVLMLARRANQERTRRSAGHRC